MWKKIKRIIKSAILMSIGICFAKGTYEEGPEPELLTTPEGEAALEELIELAGTTPTLPGVTLPPFPTLPGISAQEKRLLGYGMSAIEKLVSGVMPEAFGMGMEKIKSILGGEYDPLTSPYYTGLKEETARFEEKGISDIRQRSQLGGMLYSEPAMGAEAEFRGVLGTGLTKELGRLYEADIGRQAGMIPQLLSYAGLEAGMPAQALAGIGALAPLAGVERGITTQQALGGFGVGTQQALADWQVGTQQELFPWTHQAPILQSIADWGTWYQPEMLYKPGPFDWLLGLGSAWLGKK